MFSDRSERLESGNPFRDRKQTLTLPTADGLEPSRRKTSGGEWVVEEPEF